MSGMDRFYQRQKEKESKSKTLSSGGMDRFYQKQHYNSIDTSSVNDNFIKSFYSDASNFFSKTEPEENGYTTWQDLSARANTLKAWTWQNRNNLTEDSYKSLNESLDTFNTAGAFWNQFKTADDYAYFYNNQSLFTENNDNTVPPNASEAPKYTVGEKIFDSAGYALDKLARGVIDGIEGVTDFAYSIPLTAGWLLTGGDWLANPVSNWFKETYNYVNEDDVTDYFTSAEKMYPATPQWVENVGWIPETVGNMLPFIVETVATGGAGSADDLVVAGKSLWDDVVRFLNNPDTHFGMSAAGSATEEAVKMGATPFNATAYGAASGAMEMMTEKLFGGFAGTDIGDALIDFNVKSPALRKTLNFLTEGLEEVISAGADPALQKLSGVNPDAEWTTWSEYAESGSHGVILSIVMNIATMPLQKYGKVKVTQEVNKAVEAMNGVIEDNSLKITPLSENATEAEIIQKQKELQVAAAAFDNAVNKAVQKEQQGTTTVPDTLEQAAMDVVNGKNGKETKPFTFTEAQKVTGWGNYGSELVTSLANSEGTTLDQAKKTVETAYLAGFTGMDKAQASFVTEMQEKAFDAGKRDGIMQNTAAKEKAKTATVYGKDSGVIKNEYYEKLSPAEQEMFSVFAEDFGESAEMVNEIVAAVIDGKKYTASAEHSDGKIRGSATTSKPVHQWILHENGHRMEQFATDEWNTLSGALYARAEQLGRRMKLGVSEGMAFDSVRNKYNNAGQELSTRGYVGEVVMRELETIFSSAEEFNAWRAELDAKPQVKTAWAKFMEWLTEILEKIKAIVANRKLSPEVRAAAKAEIAEIERIKELYASAYKATRTAVAERTAAMENAKAEQTEATTKKAEATKQTEAQTEPDTLEKAAKDVVDQRNAAQARENKSQATNEGKGEQTPTQKETTHTAKNKPTPESEFDNVLKLGTGFVDGKQRVAEFYSTSPSKADAIEFLKKEYGIGGQTITLADGTRGYTSHDAKGLKIDNYKGDVRVFSWSEVDDHLRKLIKNGEYGVKVTSKLPANKTAKTEKKAEAVSTDESYPMREAARAVVADLERGLTAEELQRKSFEAITARESILKGADGGRKLTEAELQEAKIQEAKYFYYKDSVKNPQEMLNHLKPFVESGKPQTVKKTEKTLFDKYNEIKQKYPNNVVLYRVGDFFEVIGEDAKAVAEWADLTLMSRNNHSSGRVPMVGFPYHKLESFLDKIRKHQDVTLVQEENGVVKEYPMATLEDSKPKATVSKKEQVQEKKTTINVNETLQKPSFSKVAEGEIRTLKHSKSVYPLFKGANMVRTGEGIIASSQVAIPLTDEALAEIKKVVEERNIGIGDSFSFKKLGINNNDIVISGNPKIVEKLYVFKVGSEYYICEQRFLDAFNNGENTIKANKDKRIPWAVYDKNGNIAGAFVSTNVPMTDAKYDSLQSVTDVLDANKTKKAAQKTAPFNATETNLLCSSSRLLTFKMNGDSYITDSFVVIKTDNSALEYIKGEYKAKSNNEVTSIDGANVEAVTKNEVVGEVSKTVADNITETDKNGKERVKHRRTAVIIGDMAFLYNTKYVDMLSKRSTTLKILSGGNLASTVLAGYDSEGGLVGFIMPIRPAGNSFIEVDGKKIPYTVNIKKNSPAPKKKAATKETPKKAKPKVVETTAKIDDFGEKIGGARKDQWNTRGLLVDDLDGMNERERENNVKKDNVWKRPNYRALVEAGGDRGLLWAVNEIRKSLQQNIFYGYSHNLTAETKAEKQKLFIETVRAIQEMAENAKTQADLEAMGEKWLLDNGYLEKTPNKYKPYAYTNKFSNNPALYGTNYLNNIRYLAKNFDKLTELADRNQFAVDAKSVVPKGYSIVGGEGSTGSKLVNGEWVKDTSFGVAKGRYIIKDGFATKEAALEWLKQGLAKKKGKTRFVPEQLLEVHRKGPDYRNSKNVDGQNYIDTFGFKGGEFGNWMSAKDRQVSLDYGFDALKDLADALGMADTDISFNGNLNIAFGARGQGLSGAAAHYENERRVINLTKMNGAGSLAHEWFHALDDFIGGYTNNFATDRYHTLPGRTKQAIRDLITTMQYKDATQEETDLSHQKRYEQAVRGITNTLENEFQWVDFIEKGVFKDSDARYYNKKPTTKDAKKYRELLNKLIETGDAKYVDELSNLRKEVNGRVIPKEVRDSFVWRLASLNSAKAAPIQRARKMTDFYNDSRTFGKLHAKDGDYWDSTVEMSARAFACYVADKTNKQNDYLSAHSDSAVTLAADKDGNPVVVRAFPVGEERTAINNAFDNLIEALKADGFLHERTQSEKPADVSYSLEDDEYLELAENPDQNEAKLREMVKNAAKAAGYTEEVFHGMGNRYNTYKSGNGQYGAGVYFTADKGIASDYGKVVDHLFVKIGNIADYEDAYKALGKTDSQTLDEFAQSLGFPNFDDMISDWDNDPTEVASNPDLIDMLKNRGFEGFIDDGNAGFVLWDFDGIAYRIKSAEPVTYDDNGDVIPLSERFNSENKDIRYSLEDDADYAPTFYSYMGRVIDNMKQEKIGANSVVSYLTGRGVKTEEIKWSGIEAFLEGKKSVTKAELQEFVSGSMLQIEENTLSTKEASNFKYNYTDSEAEKLNDIQDNIAEAWDKIYALWEETFGDEVPDDIVYNDNSLRLLKRELNKRIEDKHDYNYNQILSNIKDIESWESQQYDIVEKAKARTKEVIAPKWSDYKLDGGDNYREITFKMTDSTYSNAMMRTHWGDNAEGILAHARIQDFVVDGKKMLFIEEIQSDWHNEGSKEGYESDVTDAERTEFDELTKFIDTLNEQYEAISKEKSQLDYDYFKAEKISSDEYFDKASALISKLEKITSKLDRSINRREKLGAKVLFAVPDAPFKNNYHEYVLKRLIREAAEKGYDSIGWTTADIQSKRWSDEYAEGYRIEYDQDIPKFLRKYGKKWGATVGKTTLKNKGYLPEDVQDMIDDLERDIEQNRMQMDELDEDNEYRLFLQDGIEDMQASIERARKPYVGETIWSMNIPDSMKNSVLFEGQAQYSLDDLDEAPSKKTKEFLNAIEDLRNGKRNATDKLVKYVDSGMISTDDYDSLIEKYGVIPEGEKPHREIQVPQKTAKDKKVSQTVRTILEAKATPDEAIPTIEKMVEDGVFSYDVYTDKQAISDADAYIKEYGWEESLRDWLDSVNKGEVSKQITAMGWALYNNAANTAATSTDKTEKSVAVRTSLEILNAMVQHQRSAAQALQATRILKKLAPETQLYSVQKSVSALQKELTEKYGKKAPDLKIDEKLAEDFLNAKTQEERDAAAEKIYKDIGRQTPSDWLDKWNAWRYTAMLGNPRTHIKNIAGNAFFAPVFLTKNLTATAIESIVYRVSGGKTLRGKALVTGKKADRALLKAAWGDYATVADRITNGGKYNDSALANRSIEEGRQIFKFKPLENTRKFTSAALETEDMWFSQPHYAYALAQYCKANNITPEQIERGKAIAPAREYAIKEAQKATYRDTNAFSHFVSKLGRNNMANKNSVEKAASAVIEGVLPFRKTPANILVRGIEYSPIGLLKGLTYDLYKVSKSKMTSTEAIDNISAGLTGTGLLALGALLAAQGLVRGSGSGDKEEKEFMETMGHQAYSLELPNGQSITLDWLAPEALPFFVGVNLWEATKGSDETVNFSSILSAITNVSDPMLEMSFLQGLNDVFESVGYASSNDTSALMAILSSAVTSYFTQAFPTIMGQIERTGEEYRMSTYTEKDAFLTKDMQYILGKISAKIPFWDYQQIPYIDAWGRKEASGSALKRGFNNFLNPAYTSTIETSDMEKELLRLFEQTGENSVFPERANMYFTVDGERKDLTADEYVKYATLKGEKSYEVITNLVQSEGYKNLSDSEKVKAIEEAYTYADQKAKSAISNYKADSWVNAADKLGTNVEDFFSFRANVSAAGDDGSTTKSEVVDIITNMDLDNDDAWTLYLSKYDSKSAVEAEKYGINAELFMTAVVDMASITPDYDRNGKAINGSRKAKIQRYLSSVCGSYREYLFLLATEYDSYKDDSDYIAYFGK